MSLQDKINNAKETPWMRYYRPYELLNDMKRTEDGIFNHVKSIEKELEITGDKWVDFGEELKDVFKEGSEEGNEVSN